MRDSSTKQRILDTSLKLFSQRGYHAVSIRDICGEVGIKESSVYYHFKNKRAILDELRQRFEAAANGLMNRLDEAVCAPFGAKDFSGEDVSKVFFDSYLTDDFCNGFLRLLSMERQSDGELRQLYDRWCFQEPLSFQAKIFSVLTGLGILKPADSEYLAVKYYAPIFLFFQRYLMSGELTAESKALFCEKANAHIHKFFMENGRD